MLIEPRAPQKVDAVSGLKHGLQFARPAAAHKAEMAAVGTRHHLQNGARLAMLSGAQDDSLVTPFHA
ncbi:hypothetical protein J2X35_000467 [Mesorhizobium sp. BE184]|nr:hypothetical protein [Mesorhizobium sp. BE184]